MNWCEWSNASVLVHFVTSKTEEEEKSSAHNFFFRVSIFCFFFSSIMCVCIWAWAWTWARLCVISDIKEWTMVASCSITIHNIVFKTKTLRLYALMLVCITATQCWWVGWVLFRCWFCIRASVCVSRSGCLFPQYCCYRFCFFSYNKPLLILFISIRQRRFLLDGACVFHRSISCWCVTFVCRYFWVVSFVDLIFIVYVCLVLFLASYQEKRKAKRTEFYW